MAKKIALITTFGIIIPLKPEQLVTIKQDKKYPSICYVQTTIKNGGGKLTWFSFKHSAKEVIDMYHKCKYGNGGL